MMIMEFAGVHHMRDFFAVQRGGRHGPSGPMVKRQWVESAVLLAYANVVSPSVMLRYRTVRVTLNS